MVEKKPGKKILINVNNLREEELDQKLDEALDALLGPEEDGQTREEKVAQKVSSKEKKRRPRTSNR